MLESIKGGLGRVLMLVAFSAMFLMMAVPAFAQDLATEAENAATTAVAGGAVVAGIILAAVILYKVIKRFAGS